MSWQILDNEEVQCKPVNAETSFTAADNLATAGNIAVELADTDDATFPMPTVQKGTTDGAVPYGKLVVWDDTVKELTVATGGIQTFTKSSPSTASDIGKGIRIDGSTDGTVKTDTGEARGTIIARNGTTLYVDMRGGVVTNA